MKRTTPRQVRRAARILGRHAKHDRLWALPLYARSYVTTNKRTHTVSTTKLAQLSKEEMDRLLRDLKR